MDKAVLRLTSNVFDAVERAAAAHSTPSLVMMENFHYLQNQLSIRKLSQLEAYRKEAQSMCTGSQSVARVLKSDGYYCICAQYGCWGGGDFLIAPGSRCRPIQAVYRALRAAEPRQPHGQAQPVHGGIACTCQVIWFGQYVSGWGPVRDSTERESA